MAGGEPVVRLMARMENRSADWKQGRLPDR
jgi:hypothetical protein